MRKYVPIVRTPESPRGYERALSNGKISARKGGERGNGTGRERGGEGGRIISGDWKDGQGQGTSLRPISLGSGCRGSRLKEEVRFVPYNRHVVFVAVCALHCSSCV